MKQRVFGTVAIAVCGLAAALCNLGYVALCLGECETARSHYEESLRVGRDAGERTGAAYALGGLAHIEYLEGSYAQARTLIEQSLALLEKGGDRGAIADAMVDLALIALRQGELQSARRCASEGLAIARSQRDLGASARAIALQGRLDSFEGRHRAARSALKRSLALLVHSGDREPGPACLEWLAEAEAALGMPERAARLWGAAEAARETMGTPPPPVDRPSYEQAVAAARAALGELAFAAAWATGRVHTLDQAMVAAAGKAPDV